MPTNTEWDTADTFGAWDNNTDTFNSDLKLPSVGHRNFNNGLLNHQGTYGDYWSSTVSGTTMTRVLHYSSTAASTSTGNGYRAYGLPVRCLKN